MKTLTIAIDGALRTPGDHTEETIQALSAFLASTYMLYQQTLFYHWNVTGPRFSSLHKLFEDLTEDLYRAGNLIAARIRVLGYFSPATFGQFLDRSSIREDLLMPENDRRMVENLLASHEICAVEAEHVFSVAEKSEDQVTMELMRQRMDFHEKSAWMLRAFLS